MKHLLALLFALLASSLSAQEFAHTRVLMEGDSSPEVSLEDLTWIAGHWRGEAMGGITEELWTAPLGGSMMGSFKLATADSVIFYELMHIQQQGATVLLQIRHFSGNLFAWEEKDETEEFALVAIEGKTAYFEGLTFSRSAENELIIYVRMGEGEEATELAFQYVLVE